MARSGAELERALQGWTDRVNNYVHADVGGHIGYCLAGRVPIKDEANGRGPLPPRTHPSIPVPIKFGV
nr:penicillin acylase family protein [Sphingomonas sp. Y57]